MAFSFNIGPVVVRGDTPDETLREGYRQAQRVAATALQALTTGNVEEFKSLAGQLVLNNNLATEGALKAAQEVFPKVPAESFEKVVGAGVLTFLSTGDATLTVYAAANEFLGVYPDVNVEVRTFDRVPADLFGPVRMKKIYSANCKKIWRRTEGSKVYYYAGFHMGPDTTFVDDINMPSVWPAVDFRKGDVVRLKSTENLAPTAEETLDEAVGQYTGLSKNTPGLGANQVTLILEFEHAQL